MKKSKKMLSAAVVFSMTAALLSPLAVTKAEAASFSTAAIAQYDFEAGTGMSSSGIGTAPTVVNDGERGNVLQFADGSTSKIINHDVDTSLEQHSWRIEEGSPSSLKFTNPFKGRSLTGATISFWVKLPNEKAGDVSDDGEVGEGYGISGGIVGFVDSEFRLLRHPDCVDGGHSDDMWGSRSCFGITAKPSAYFAQIHHNWIMATDVDASLTYDIGTWKYCAMSITNDTIKIYIDGKELKSTEILKGKRFWGSEEYNNPGNQGMPFLLDFLSDNMSYTFGGKAGTVTLTDKNSKKPVTYGKVDSNVECFVGFTGFSPTYAGTCIDDLTFFTEAFSASKMAELYEAAKTPGGIPVNGGSSNTTTTETSKALSKEEATALASSFKAAAGDIAIVNAAPIMEDDAAYAAVKAILDNGISAVVASNPEWNGLKIRRSQIFDFNFTGSGEIEGDVPAGWDANSIWVLYIDEAANTVTKCDAVVADGKLRFIPKTSGKYVLVEMKTSTSMPKTGVVDNAYFLILGSALLVCGLVLIRRKKTASL